MMHINLAVGWEEVVWLFLYLCFFVNTSKLWAVTAVRHTTITTVTSNNKIQTKSNTHEPRAQRCPVPAASEFNPTPPPRPTLCQAQESKPIPPCTSSAKWTDVDLRGQVRAEEATLDASVPEANLTFQHLSRASQYPFKEKVEWFNKQCDLLRVPWDVEHQHLKVCEPTCFVCLCVCFFFSSIALTG